MAIPPRPAVFAPDVPPPGVVEDLVSFWQDRPLFKVPVDSQLAHTNGASVESSIRSSKAHSERAPGKNTCAHFQVDRDGSAAMFLPTNRVGIGNGTVTSSNDDWWKLTAEQRSEITEHGRVALHSIVIETADTGYLDDPTISAFTDEQCETVAVIFAYNAVVHPAIRLDPHDHWHGAGSCSHTDPFGYPFTTTARGKICPGDKKKRQVRDVIIPRAREIHAAWTAPDPSEEDDMTPEQSRKLDAIHAVLLEQNPWTSEKGMSMSAQLTQVHVIMRTFWDGFPNTIRDAPGVLARTIKNIAAKVGAKAG